MSTFLDAHQITLLRARPRQICISLGVKQGILAADATSEELPCAVLPEFASAENVADVIELRKQNAGCVNNV